MHASLRVSVCAHKTLSRRFPCHVPWPSLSSVVRSIEHVPGTLKSPRDISREQLRWQNYCRDVKSLCSSYFWEFFLPMHTYSRSAIDTALRCARTTFSQFHQFQNFPTTTRTLFRKMRESVSVYVSLRLVCVPLYVSMSMSLRLITCVLT